MHSTSRRTRRRAHRALERVRDACVVGRIRERAVEQARGLEAVALGDAPIGLIEERLYRLAHGFGARRIACTNDRAAYAGVRFRRSEDRRRQLCAERVRGRPFLGRRREAALDQGGERARHAPIELIECTWGRRDVATRRLHEGSVARDELVQHHPEREDVDGRRCGQSFEELRGDVAERTAHGAIDARHRGADIEGESEVEDDDAARGREHHVLGLQVAVHEAARVHRSDRFDHGRQTRDGVLGEHRAFCGDRAERPAVDIVGDEVRPMVGVFADVDQRGEARTARAA